MEQNAARLLRLDLARAIASQEGSAAVPPFVGQGITVVGIMFRGNQAPELAVRVSSGNAGQDTHALSLMRSALSGIAARAMGATGWVDVPVSFGLP